MRYTVYKQTHRENVRWYIKPLMTSEPKDNCIVFEGEDGILVKANVSICPCFLTLRGMLLRWWIGEPIWAIA
jgi:hypothetical protein